jgi:hypothetical protein
VFVIEFYLKGDKPEPPGTGLSLCVEHAAVGQTVVVYLIFLKPSPELGPGVLGRVGHSFDQHGHA